jgi:hypothetical protein
MAKKNKPEGIQWKKVETVEEFIARGGEIKIFPPQESGIESHTMKANGSLNQDHMTLGEGELMFGETRKRKKKEKPIITDEEFAKMLASVKAGTFGKDS